MKADVLGGYMKIMHVKTLMEVFYLAFMLKWERTAPEDGKHGLLGGRSAINSQVERLRFLLRLIACGDESRVFNCLSNSVRREDGGSYVARTGLRKPHELYDGWMLEGCQSLDQKLDIVWALQKLGFSCEFLRCAEDFVSGMSVKSFIPDDQEMEEMLKDTVDPLLSLQD